MNDDVLRGLREVLRERRDELQLTQEQVAHRMGTSLSRVSELEGGKRDSANPKMSTVLRWVEALEIDELAIVVRVGERSTWVM